MYKIYKIVDNTNDNVYIGITMRTLKQRLNNHKASRGRCSSRDIIKNGDYRIELIEETDDKMRERHWIENTECVNERIPCRIKGEYKKEWYKQNKEKKKEYHQEYRKNNKEKYTEYSKIRNKWMSSMGGRPNDNNMSLLKIDPYLFN